MPLVDGFEVYRKATLAHDDTAMLTKTLILFLPYMGGVAQTFEPIIDNLTAKFEGRNAISCIAISYPGTGRHNISEASKDLSEHAVSGLAQRLFSALPELFDSNGSSSADADPSTKLVICAHSMSAKVTYLLLYHIACSERYGAWVRQKVDLVFLAPAPVMPLVLPEKLRLQSREAYDSIESAQWTVENILSYRKLGKDVVNKLARDCHSWSSEARCGWTEIGMHTDCSDALKSAKAVIGTINVVVGGEDMVETRTKVEADIKIISELTAEPVALNVVDGAGHLLPVEAVDECVAVLSGLL